MTGLSRRRITRSLALATLSAPALLPRANAQVKTQVKQRSDKQPDRAPQNTTEFRVPDRLQAHLSELFGNQPIVADSVSVSLPALAENGNSVALGISIDAEKIDETVKSLFVFAEKNPLPDIARFHFTDVGASAELALRIRLADSQQVIAVAQTSSGALYAGAASIIVTLAACIDIPQ